MSTRQSSSASHKDENASICSDVLSGKKLMVWVDHTFLIKLVILKPFEYSCNKAVSFIVMITLYGTGGRKKKASQGCGYFSYIITQRTRLKPCRNEPFSFILFLLYRTHSGLYSIIFILQTLQIEPQYVR